MPRPKRSTKNAIKLTIKPVTVTRVIEILEGYKFDPIDALDINLDYWYNWKIKPKKKISSILNTLFEGGFLVPTGNSIGIHKIYQISEEYRYLEFNAWMDIAHDIYKGEK